jgi:hypothetical protein
MADATTGVHRGARERGGWPEVARAQTPPAVIRYLAQGTQEGSAEFVSSVRKGLGEAVTC